MKQGSQMKQDENATETLMVGIFITPSKREETF